MRDMPLVLNVPWGKNRGAHYFRNCLLSKEKYQAPQKKEEPAPQKKEEPRGNGARRKRKT
jgi:hypothetical protein